MYPHCHAHNQITDEQLLHNRRALRVNLSAEPGQPGSGWAGTIQVFLVLTVAKPSSCAEESAFRRAKTPMSVPNPCYEDGER